MALYRGMDIGTAKPTPEERSRVPHHLIDIVDPSAEFSVAQYVAAAAAAVADIRSRGKEPLFVGGTPLYLKSLLRGLFDGPPADWQLRHEIEEELEQVGQSALYERLAQVDPVAASHIHPHDTRRLIRALEVLSSNGRTDQPSAIAIRRGPAGRRMPRVRAAAATRGATCPHRTSRGSDGGERTGRGSSRAHCRGQAAWPDSTTSSWLS